MSNTSLVFFVFYIAQWVIGLIIFMFISKKSYLKNKISKPELRLDYKSVLLISCFIISPLLSLLLLHKNNSSTIEEKKNDKEANKDIAKKNKVYPKDASDKNISKQDNSKINIDK